MTWLIFFEDAGMKPEIFMGEGAGKVARQRYEELLVNWNCSLFFSEVVVNEILAVGIEAGRSLEALGVIRG